MAETRYLDLAGAADLLGIRRQYLYQLRSRYRHGRGPAFPDPDATIFGREAWLPETILRWNASRPGQGAGGGRKRRD